MKTNSRHKIVDGLVCKRCGELFSAREQRVKAGLAIFCSRKCASLWQAEQNGKKYVGKENGKTTFDKQKGLYYVYWFDPETLKRKTTSYAHWYWEVYKGEVPDGYRASYKDGNPLNIEPENIILISPEEFGKVVSERLMGHGFSDETLQKMSEAKAGKPLSDEHKLNIGNASRQLWAEGRFDKVHIGENNKHWRGGVEKNYPREFSLKLKAEIKERDKYKCRICSTGLYKSRYAPIHHINGNRNDNNPENLILLCNDCHSKIHNPSSTEDVILAFRSKLYWNEGI